MTGQLGTPAYMANEMLNQRLDAGEKGARLTACDVFSYGVLINALWARQRPYEDLKISAFDLLMQVNEGLRPTMADTLPPAMRALIEQCWHGVPDQRLTFQQVVKALSNEKLLDASDDEDSD
jgi:serine/threonine protein kinase